MAKKQITLAEVNNDLTDLSDEYEGIQRAQAYVGRTFEDYDTNISINSDFNRRDYDYFRPSDRLPRKPKERVEACMKAYDDIGIVSNVIDLMSEFGCDGLSIVHPVPSIQRFYEKWFEKVNGYNVSERFLNYLYRTANVFCTRKEAKIGISTVREWKKSFAITDGFKEQNIQKKTIPIKYIFRDPRRVTIINQENMEEESRYGLEVSFKFKNYIMKNKNRNLVDEDVYKSLAGGTVMPLNPEHTIVFFYKKDDWDDWAKPMINPIISNLITLEKMHLADISALDGAISNIRLWNIGVIDTTNPGNSILPTRKAINKLRSILHNRGTGGVLDLVWGPELSFKESATSVHQFLGSSKYEQNMKEIYGGLGITSSLLGGDANGKSMSNNFVSLQTLVKRLQYGRRLLTDFWRVEIKRVQKAMGFSKPAKIRFSSNLLNDEATKNKLLLDLVDRDVLSVETVLNEFSFDSDLEKSRLKKELAERQKNNMPEKAGPYHDPQKEDRLKEILLQNGGVAPSEVGFELQERKDGEKSMREILHEQAKEIGKGTTDVKKPVGKSGRPKNAGDKQKRKQKVFVKPTSGFIQNFLWGNAAQKEISNIIDKPLLDFYKKKNMRSLTASEKQNIENAKFSVLCNIAPMSTINASLVKEILDSSPKINSEIISIAKLLTKQFMQQNNREPNMEEIREIQSCAYAVYTEEEYE